MESSPLPVAGLNDSGEGIDPWTALVRVEKGLVVVAAAIFDRPNLDGWAMGWIWVYPSERGILPPRA
jgi:hypothetical protein